MVYLALFLAGGSKIYAQEAASFGQKNNKAALTNDVRQALTPKLLLENLKLPPATLTRLESRNAKVYIALRSNGRKLADAWSETTTGQAAILEAANNAINQLTPTLAPDTVELVIAYDFKSITFDAYKSHFSNIHRGINGIELRYGTHQARFSPTEMIANNLSFSKVINRFTDTHNLSKYQLESDIELLGFSADQFLLNIGRQPYFTQLFRGNQTIGIESVTRMEVEKLARRMSDWMIRNVDINGKMAYKYWPSNGQYSDANNMIRQWMASVCLIRISEFYNDQDIAALAERNIQYNLEQFYQSAGSLGFIEFNGKAKLGSTALAALAIADLPGSSSLSAYEAALRATIFHLWRDNGAFLTFLKPINRNDNQNFYPGEALVYLSKLQSITNDATLLMHLQRSIEYYRSWHLENRNPAFIPWHTMAYAQIWQQTRDPALSDWIFEMNDWLLGIQQNSSITNPDTVGRFYDPTRPQYGPPHASATGVYLEGLIQAYNIAKEIGDTKRASSYQSAILHGLRSLLQLEFNDDVDMYYISKPDHVYGGLRTTVYNNEIRVDNVQHGLMAILEVLKAFKDEDYAPSSL